MDHRRRIDKLRGAIHAMRLVALDATQGGYDLVEAAGTISILGGTALDEDAAAESNGDRLTIPMFGLKLDEEGPRSVKLGYRGFPDGSHAILFTNQGGEETRLRLSDEGLQALIRLYTVAAAHGEHLHAIAAFIDSLADLRRAVTDGVWAPESEEEL